jgi:type VI secretion system secreted protein Hcp
MAVDYFLKLSNSIAGESEATGHTGEIGVLSFSFGASQTSSIGGTVGSGAGKANMVDLSIMKGYDKSSIPLLKALCLGTHIDTGVLVAQKAGGAGKPYIKWSFTELFVTSLQTSASSEVPTESVSFSFKTIKEEYFTQDAKGTVTAAGAISFDVAKNAVS